MNTTTRVIILALAFFSAYFIMGALRNIVRHLDRIATCLEKGGRLLDRARWQIEGVNKNDSD